MRWTVHSSGCLGGGLLWQLEFGGLSNGDLCRSTLVLVQYSTGIRVLWGIVGHSRLPVLGCCAVARWTVTSNNKLSTVQVP